MCKKGLKVDELKALYFKSIKEYQLLFKAGVILLGLGLTGLIQTTPIISKLSSDTRLMQYKLEEKYLVSHISEIDCNGLKLGQADCRFAKYKYFENETTIDFAAKIIVFILYLGASLITFSGYAFSKNAKKEYVAHNNTP
jgi:hypothetical protein